jgi:hypothetical protein
VLPGDVDLSVERKRIVVKEDSYVVAVGVASQKNQVQNPLDRRCEVRSYSMNERMEGGPGGHDRYWQFETSVCVRHLAFRSAYSDLPSTAHDRRFSAMVHPSCPATKCPEY